jgi:hypothetical protein
MENGKQTAVEWFYDKLENHEIQAKHYDLFQQAKQMEKEQIMMAYNDGRVNQGLKQDKNSEKYYNETYGK